MKVEKGKAYKQVEVARLLQEAFPDKKISGNLSFLTFYKAYWKVGKHYTIRDLVVVGAMILCADLGISPKYLIEVLKTKEKEKKNATDS